MKGKPIIIADGLTKLEEHKLLETLKKYKQTIAWSIEDLKGINSYICMHKILMQENAKTSIEHQRRLNLVKHYLRGSINEVDSDFKKGKELC